MSRLRVLLNLQTPEEINAFLKEEREKKEARKLVKYPKKIKTPKQGVYITKDGLYFAIFTYDKNGFSLSCSKELRGFGKTHYTTCRKLKSMIYLGWGNEEIKD